VCKEDREDAGFFDASIWEEAKKKGDLALKRLIHEGLKNTSNTCVLIGSETYARPWVRYELLKSIDVGNHLFGVHINGIKGKDGKTKDILGPNPFDYVGLEFNKNGEVATPIELKNGTWKYYDKLEAIKLNSAIDSSFWNKSYKLSRFFKTYKWYKDDGYNNFSNWII
jgi:hypothetical protein